VRAASGTSLRPSTDAQSACPEQRRLSPHLQLLAAGEVLDRLRDALLTFVSAK
jgi:hypothetical protein